MCFRIIETMTLEHTSTNVVATPSATLFATACVTASAEQSPSVCTSTGFWCHNPRVRTAPVLLGGPVSLITMLMRYSSHHPGELRARQMPREMPLDITFAEAIQSRGRGI